MNTKSFLSLLGLLLISTTLSAQTSVWKVTKDRRSVYLGGTCPVLRAGDYPLPKEFDQAFTASPQIYFETDIYRLLSTEIQQDITNRAQSPAGNTLDKIISPESWRSIQDLCGMVGIPEDNMNKVRAWRCRAMLTSLEMQKQGVIPKTMDAFFFQRTLGTEKIVNSLDTIEQYIAQLTSQGAGREKELIDYSLNEISGLAAKHEAMIKAWQEGDLTKLDELFLKNLRTDHPALYRDLITQLNTAWLPKIEVLFQTSKPKFVLIGVKHLAGPEGVIAQLRQRGYTIEQVKASKG
jgi:uncharacterized protein YbaP (TraB family)